MRADIATDAGNSRKSRRGRNGPYYSGKISNFNVMEREERMWFQPLHISLVHLYSCRNFYFLRGMNNLSSSSLILQYIGVLQLVAKVQGDQSNLTSYFIYLIVVYLTKRSVVQAV